MSKGDFLSTLANVFTESDSSVTYEYDFINAFAADLKGTALESVRRSSGIEFIEQDTILSIDYE